MFAETIPWTPKNDSKSKERLSRPSFGVAKESAIETCSGVNGDETSFLAVFTTLANSIPVELSISLRTNKTLKPSWKSSSVAVHLRSVTFSAKAGRRTLARFH